MYINSEIQYIRSITPVHAGIGQDLGIADMPIQREKHSNIPKIEASTLKGSIKSYLYRKYTDDEERKQLYKIFGGEDGEASSSLIGFTDAKLLLFPVKSMSDFYKLITCPYIISRWLEDLMLNGEEESDFNVDNYSMEDGTAISLGDNEEDTFLLEEYVFSANRRSDTLNGKIDELKKLFQSIKGVNLDKVLILSNSDFSEMISMHTEIITRNKIDIDKGVADKTGLFTEEYLPAESILYFIVLETGRFQSGEGGKEDKNSKNNSIDYYKGKIGSVFQVGANLTIGKGFVRRLNTEG